MKAGVYNIRCDQGADFNLTFVVTDDEDTPYDWTGCTARMQVRREVDSNSVLVELTTANGRIVLGAEGEITLTMDAATTAGITRSGVYDIEVVTASGQVNRPLRGDFILDPEVTR